jgi:hypothetical protein
VAGVAFEDGLIVDGAGVPGCRDVGGICGGRPGAARGASVCPRRD